MDLPRLNISVHDTLKRAIVMACARAIPQENMTEFARKALLAELKKRKAAASELGAGK